MAIEPLGSIMTVQATAKVEPVQPVSGSTEANPRVEKIAPDPTTVVVAKADGKKDGTSNEANIRISSPATNRLSRQLKSSIRV